MMSLLAKSNLSQIPTHSDIYSFQVVRFNSRQTWPRRRLSPISWVPIISNLPYVAYIGKQNYES